MTEFIWIEGPLEGETETLEFHAVDPEIFIAELWLREGEWVLDMTRREGDGYVTSRARVSFEDPDAVETFAWANRKLSEFL
jgi:hypothetical protein